MQQGVEFWRRYPEKYSMPNGLMKFRPTGFISDLHMKYLDDQYFEFVGACARFPRYKNKRGLDANVKLYLDDTKTVIPAEWGLPMPNAPAAYKSLSKYGKSTVNMEPRDVSAMNEAFTMMCSHFYPYMKNSRIISCEEAIEKADKTTSTGCPFNSVYKTKAELYDDPDTLPWMKEQFELLATNPHFTYVFSSSMKEELRPAEKILDNSIRTFTAGPADATTHGTQLFSDMNGKMYDSHLKSASVIGMSPLKGNWDALYRKLNVFKNGYALDESQYDSSLRDFLMWGCAKFRWMCLVPEEQTQANLQRFKTYYRNLINTVVLTAEGILIMKKGGNPSGSVNTVTDNTLILYWILAYAWLKLTPKEYHSLAMFELNTSKALLGDDNTWTVSDPAHVFYNAVSVINEWKNIGITTTTDSLEPREAKDLDFLSAQTIFLHGRAVPLYNRNKLMQALLYAKKKGLCPAVTLQRACALLQIGWTNIPLRDYVNSFIDYLVLKYDRVLLNDPDWIIAKTNIKPPAFYEKLFLGELLQPQSCGEVQERSRKPHKSSTMSTNGSAKKVKKSRSARRARGPKKGTSTGQQPQKSVRKNVRKPRARGGMRAGGKASGIGRTSFKQQNVRSITVSNDEFIQAITVANQPAFDVNSLSMNPGQAETFPWLSTQAKQWEKYRFTHLEFYYKRTVSEFAPAGVAGKVIFSADFDASDAPPATKQQMEDTIPHADAMPCENFGLTIPKSQMDSGNSLGRYVRVGGLPGNADIKTYDVGTFHFATQGIPSNTEVGELRVRYSVILSVPVLENLTGAPINRSISSFKSNSIASVNGGVLTTIPLATEITNGLLAVNTAGAIVLPIGNYLISGGAWFDDNGGGGVITSCRLSLVKAATEQTGMQTVLGAAAVTLDTNIGIPPTFVQSDAVSQTFYLKYTLAATIVGQVTAHLTIQAV